MEKIEIKGTVKKGFEGVAEAYESNFYRDDIYKELGSSLCVYHKGEQVVNIWAGFKDKEKNRLGIKTLKLHYTPQLKVLLGCAWLF
ncbi:hypothetical protein [Aquimarina agarivorans]|uniref:hypothetical protein n=1 Tax=Aquimarina agarivorans TaxID=980584 RepID=UPI000248F61B|nr:hypothetical protein [Aquimarina agarivorans]